MAILYIGAVLRACKRTRVSDFDLSFLSAIHAKCVNIMTLIAYIVLKGRKTPIPTSSLNELNNADLRET